MRRISGSGFGQLSDLPATSITTKLIFLGGTVHLQHSVFVFASKTTTSKILDSPPEMDGEGNRCKRWLPTTKLQS